MTMLLVWVLLVVKHGVLAHIVDFGYSQSRDPNSPWWALGLVGVMMIELSVTYTMFSLMALHGSFAVCAAEAIFAILTCLAERRASITHMLRIHILSELSLLVAYGILLGFVVRM